MPRIEKPPRHFLPSLIAMLIVVIGAPLIAALLSQDHPDAPAAHKDAQDAISAAELARDTPKIAREVQALRGIKFKHIPHPEVISTARLGRLFQAQYDKPKARAEISETQLLLGALGLLAPGDDLQSSLEGSADTVAGAYDPETKRLYVIGGPTLGNRALAEITLAHELNHALEDQVFGLPDETTNSGDQALAEQAFVEGSATALMTDYASAYIDPGELLSATTDPEALADDGFGDLPKVIGQQLLFAYLRGQEMINAIRAPVDGSWKLVNIGLRSHLPASTEQVMHPEKYLSDEKPDKVVIPPSDGPGKGWKPAGSGTFGELQTEELLELDNSKAVATDAAAGWGGDRYEIWTEGNQVTVVLRTAWDTKADAKEFAAAEHRGTLTSDGRTTTLTVTGPQL